MKEPSAIDHAISDLYRSGKGLQALADQFGRSKWWIRSSLQRTKTPTRPAGNPRPRGRKTERNAAICERARNGATAAAIARDFGLTRQRVQFILAKNGIMTKANASQKRTCERGRRYAAICEDYRSGLALPEIAKRHGVAVSTAGAALRLGGICRRAQKADRTIEALQLFDEGWSVEEITKKLGYHRRSSVRALLHRYGRTKKRRLEAHAERQREAKPEKQSYHRA